MVLQSLSVPSTARTNADSPDVEDAAHRAANVDVGVEDVGPSIPARVAVTKKEGAPTPSFS